MPVNLPQLKTELQNDPASLGYAALIALGDHTGLAAVLNFRRDGSTPSPVNGVVGTAITVFRNDIAPKEIVNAIAAADFAAAQQIQISKLQILFQGAPIDATLANVRANFQGIFTSASATTTNALAALAQRNGSRCEQLFGTGTTVTQNDVANVLAS